MVRQLILVLSLILFVGSSHAVISELARQGESAIQGLADIKLAPLRYLDAVVGTNPGGLGFYGGAGGATSAAAALQAATQANILARGGVLAPSVTNIPGTGITIIRNPGSPGIPGWPHPAWPYPIGWPGPHFGRPPPPARPYPIGVPGPPFAPPNPSGRPAPPGGLGGLHIPGLRLPGLSAGANLGLFSHGGLFGTGLFGQRGLFSTGFLPGWVLDPLGIFTPIGNLFGGLGNLFGISTSSSVGIQRHPHPIIGNKLGFLDRNIGGSISLELDGSVPTPKTVLRRLLSPVLGLLG